MTLKEQSALSKTTLSPIISDDAALAAGGAKEKELKESEGEAREEEEVTVRGHMKKSGKQG